MSLNTEREDLHRRAQRLSQEAFTAWFRGDYRMAQALWVKLEQLKKRLRELQR